MASARYWRLVGLQAYAGGDLELYALHWYSGGARIDASATLTCSHAPAAGALATLQGTDPAQTVRFAAADVRSGGFWLRWDFGTAVADPVPRLGAVVKDRFLGWGVLQYSADGVAWTTDVSFGRVIYPGNNTLTGADPKLRSEIGSSWDAASKGPNASITGRSASVWAGLNGYVRTDQPRSAGRRVFGLRLDAVTSPQLFFGGFAALAGWGGYNTGKHWLSYAYDGKFYYYPTDSVIALSPEPGSATAPGDTMYFDVDLDAGTAALKKNGGAWSAPVALPNFTPGSPVVIDFQAPSSSGVQIAATLLTTGAELGGNIPSGATAWDGGAIGTDDFQEDVFMAAAGNAILRTAASAPVPESSTRSAPMLRTARDVEFGGFGRVYGTTKIKGSPNTPTRSRVRLLRERDGLLAREVWSDPASGAFEFTGVDAGTRWVVLAQDASGAFWPAAASSFDLEVLP